MVSTRKTSTLAALLILAMPISNLNAGLAESATIPVAPAVPDMTAIYQEFHKKLERYDQRIKGIFNKNCQERLKQKNYDAIAKKVDSLMEISKEINNSIAEFEAQKLQGLRYRDDLNLKHTVLQTFKDILTACEEHCKTNEGQAIANTIVTLRKQIQEQELSTQATQPYNVSKTDQQPQPIAQEKLNVAASVADRFGRPFHKPVPVATQSAAPASQFHFTKKHWGIALIGIAALVGGMTVGQTKYKMFTRLFGRMPEKVVVPQLSWWGWFFKKAIFWR